MKSIAMITLGVCTLVVAAYGQMPRRQPGPEHTRMMYFAGQWKFEGDSEGLKYASSETCEMFTGGFHLVCRGEGGGDLGPMKGQWVMTYDRGAKSYTLHTINNLGHALYAKGPVTGPVWTLDSELTGPSGPFKVRLTITEQSPTAYTLKVEGLLGGAWTMIEEGRATKVR